MKVWTLQHPKVLRILQSGRAYRPTIRGLRSVSFAEADHPEALKAYQWMRGQYRKRIGPLPSNRELVWVWTRRRPDMRIFSDRPQVRLTLDVDPMGVLESDHEAFHSILNGRPVAPIRYQRAPDTPEGDQLWDEWFDSTQGWSQKQVEATWPRIFLPSFQGPHSQGVISEIRPQQVRKVEVFR